MKYILLISLSFLIFSCKKESLDDEIIPIEEEEWTTEIIYKEIESDIKIRMTEMLLEETPQTFLLFISTEKIYPCANYGIVHSVQQDSTKIILEFSKIIVPNICMTAPEHAKTIIDLGAITNGEYELEVIVGDNKSVGQLIVTSQYFNINFEEPKQLQIEYSSINRVPPNTIWGEVRYYAAPSEVLAKSFIDSLEFLGATKQLYNQGEYLYFQIDSLGQISPQQQANDYYTKIKYIYNYPKNTSEIDSLVKNYGRNFGDSLDIVVYTKEGETFKD
jgi:hypothetical protein